MKNILWNICKALCKHMKLAITKHLQFRTLKLQLGIFQFLRSYDASHDMISWYQHNWLFISFPTLINRGAGGVEKPSWAPHTPLHRAPLKETPPTLKKVNLITLYILFVMFSTPVNPGQNQIYYTMIQLQRQTFPLLRNNNELHTWKWLPNFTLLSPLLGIYSLLSWLNSSYRTLNPVVA